MTQIVNDNLKSVCDQCHYFMNKPCAWLSLGNEYCDEIMNIQRLLEQKQEINEQHKKINGELRQIIKEAREYIENSVDDISGYDLLQILDGGKSNG